MKIPFWVEKITDVGIRRIADELQCTTMAVYKYTKRQAMPRGATLKGLCRVMQSKLPPEEFTQFMASLAEDLTGISAEM